MGSRAGRCLQTFGLDGRVSAVPTSLVMLVQVHWRRSPIAGSEISAAAHSDHSSIQVSLPRPDLGLDDLFSPAEREVIHLLVEGKTQLEMAQHRNTSPRTIANQICSVYLKGRVSGRLALINSLIALQAAPREARGSAAEVDAK